MSTTSSNRPRKQRGLDQAVSGNTLRRRYVMAADADGTDLDRIRRNAGHADRRTTRRYLDPDPPTGGQPCHGP